MNHEYDIELLKEREGIHNRLMSEGAQKIEELIAQRAELESQLARLGNEKVEMAKRLKKLLDYMEAEEEDRRCSPLTVDGACANAINFYRTQLQDILK